MTEPGNLNNAIPRSQDWIPREIAGINRRLRHLRAGGSVVTGIQLDDTAVSITSTLAGPGSSDVECAKGIAIGSNSFADATLTNGTVAIAVGPDSTADVGGGIAIGDSATATAADPDNVAGVAIGVSSNASDQAVAVGYQARAYGKNGVAIGRVAKADQSGGVAIGSDPDSGDQGAWAKGPHDVVIGGAAIADGTDGTVTSGNSEATVAGYAAYAAAGSASFGTEATCNGVQDTAIGNSAIINSSNHATALGYGALVQVGCHGSVAIGCDHTGISAVASAQDMIALGTANHIVVIKGKLVIADASAGLHQIVVSTGGVLSTVAYP